MKRKKGFTLVELLAVIVIIAVIGLIGTVATISIKEKMNNKIFNEQLKEIIAAAETYGSDNKELFEEAGTSLNTDNDLGMVVVRRTVEDLVNSGYEKTDINDIVDPNTGESMQNLEITIYLPNSSSRVKACIKDREENNTDESTSQYYLLDDVGKTKYSDVYCFSDDSLNDLLKDKPKIEVKNENDLRNLWEKQKTVEYKISDGGNNLAAYAVKEKNTDCNSTCSSLEDSEWSNTSSTSSIDASFTIAPAGYISSASYCICAKDNFETPNQSVYEVLVNNIDNEKPIIDVENSLIVIKNNKVDSSTKVIPKSESETYNKDRYSGYKYYIYYDDDEVTFDDNNIPNNYNVSIDETINGSISDIENIISDFCKYHDDLRIYAVLESKSGLTSEITNIKTQIDGCAKLTFNTTGGTFTDTNTTEKAIYVSKGSTYMFETLNAKSNDGVSVKNWIDQNGNKHQINNSEPINDNMNFTVEWDVRKVAYSITHDWNLALTLAQLNSNFEKNVVHYADEANPSKFVLQNVTPPLQILTKFVGWSTNKNLYYNGDKSKWTCTNGACTNGTDTYYEPGATIDVSKISNKTDITLYGVWVTFEWIGTTYNTKLVADSNTKTFTYNKTLGVPASVWVYNEPQVSFSQSDYSGIMTLTLSKTIYASMNGKCIDSILWGAICTKYEKTNNVNEAVGKWVGERSGGIDLPAPIYTGSEGVYKITSATTNGSDITFQGQRHHIQTTEKSSVGYTSKYADAYGLAFWSLDGKTHYACKNCTDFFKALLG